MTAAELLKIWAESCKENDDCDRCFFAEICPYDMPRNQIETLTAEEIKLFVERAEKRFGETEDHFRDTAKYDLRHGGIKDVLKAKKITPTAILPKKATQGSACYDLYPDLADPVKVPPHSDVILQTNIAVSFPDEYCGLIFARSGISTKRHLRPSTCVSVIDNDYRGSIGLPVHNDSDEEQTIIPGERIAQLMLIKPLSFELEIVDNLDETERGENGFGSSGR